MSQPLYRAALPRTMLLKQAKSDCPFQLDRGDEPAPCHPTVGTPDGWPLKPLVFDMGDFNPAGGDLTPHAPFRLGGLAPHAAA